MGRDMKEYPLCNPWHGEQGAKYERKFKPEFISATASCRDKYGNLQSHLKGQDYGAVPRHPDALYAAGGALHGCAPVPRPHPGNAGSALRVESVEAFGQRSQEGIRLLRHYCPVASVQQLLDKLVSLDDNLDYAGGAAVLAVDGAVTAAAGAVPAHVQNPVYQADHPLAGQPLSAEDLDDDCGGV